MAKQTFQMHLYAKESYEDPFSETKTTKFSLHAYDKMDCFGPYVGPVEVEVEVPDSFDMRAAKVKAKEAELQKTRAEFTARITQLQRELNELQALEMSAPAGEVA
jgi:hypothetical protein